MIKPAATDFSVPEEATTVHRQARGEERRMATFHEGWARNAPAYKVRGLW